MTRTEKLEAALRLALEYWGHRQQRYKNRHPVWVKAANDALATPPTSEWNEAIEAAASVGTLYPSQRASIPRPQAQGVAMSTLGETCQHGQLRRQCEICDLEEQLAAMTKERDEWKAKAEANEREARLYQWIVHEPESARHLLNLLREGKGTIDDFGQMIERIAASKQAARSAEKEKG